MIGTSNIFWRLTCLGCLTLAGCATHTQTLQSVVATPAGFSSTSQSEPVRNNAVQAAATTAAPSGGPLTLEDVVRMATSGASDETILETIRFNHAVYHLSAADVVQLHQQGVSNGVIQAMIDTAQLAPGAPSAIAYERPVVLEPTPADVSTSYPIYFGVSYGFYRHRW